MGVCYHIAMFARTIKAIIKAMRPKQWIKNIVLFAGLVFDRQLGLEHLPAMLRTMAGFIIFCFLSGVVYVINDLADVEADRQHPEKCHRPIASGELSISTARWAVIVMLLILFPASYLLGWEFFLVALAYFLLNLAYSKWIKHIVLLDVFAIALGFVLRVAAGVVLIDVAQFSPWLYIVTTLGALFIGFGKRRSEIVLLAEKSNSHRRVLGGYTVSLLDQYILIVSGTTIIAYSLYTFLASDLPKNHVMMLTIPLVMYGIFRYLYINQAENKGGAPEDVLFTDHPLQITIILWIVAVLIIFYAFT
jgi:4-hydroxybenzoate polyprenyltransferase